MNCPVCQQDNHHALRTEPHNDPRGDSQDIDKLRARFAKLEGFLVL